MDLQKDGDAAVQHRVLEPARPAPARHHPYAREGSEKANGRLEARPVSPGTTPQKVDRESISCEPIIMRNN